jgi:hypothetical protein
MTHLGSMPCAPAGVPGSTMTGEHLVLMFSLPTKNQSLESSTAPLASSDLPLSLHPIF